MSESISTRLKQLMDRAMTEMPHDEFLEKFKQLLDEARLEERRRACRHVLEFEVYTPYIVERRFVQERKERLVALIMGDMQ